MTTGYSAASTRTVSSVAGEQCVLTTRSGPVRRNAVPDERRDLSVGWQHSDGQNVSWCLMTENTCLFCSGDKPVQHRWRILSERFRLYPDAIG